MDFHYVLTIRWDGGPATIAHTYATGVYTAAPAQTRSDVYRHLWDQAVTLAPDDLRAPVPAFFSLEREELTER